MAKEKCQELSNYQKKMSRNQEEKGCKPSGDFVAEDDGSNSYGEIVDVIESKVKKRERREINEEEEVEEGHLLLQRFELQLQDPLNVVCSDIMFMILSFLDARGVALCLLVSRGWQRIACSDRLWSPKCEELLIGKAHIPRILKARGLSKLAAYSLSVLDGKRKRILRDDLCDHVWEFHFREAAPTYWLNFDPYWNGSGLPMRRHFHPDGSQTADPGDRVWGGHEACYTVITSLEADGSIREHYVRINRWLKIYVSRKNDWSWEMSNNLCCYTSIPDSDKEDGTGPSAVY